MSLNETQSTTQYPLDQRAPWLRVPPPHPGDKGHDPGPALRGADGAVPRQGGGREAGRRRSRLREEQPGIFLSVTI